MQEKVGVSLYRLQHLPTVSFYTLEFSDTTMQF